MTESASSLTARQYIKEKLSELGHLPKKSLGQNFLVSDSVIEKILKAVRKLKPGSLLEIGPGLGSLTKELVRLDLPLQLLELDRGFVDYWQKQGLDVIAGDALHWHWDLKNRTPPCILVSNLPYQISKSIVVDRCLDETPVFAMVLMFQKEVAQKLKAQVGSEHYGMMSVLAQTFWDLEVVCDASPNDFLPAPKVSSRVLQFQSKTSPVRDRQQFLKFLKGCFRHPRKFMISNLVESAGRPREALVPLFSTVALSEKVRAEELSRAQFLALYAALGYE